MQRVDYETTLGTVPLWGLAEAFQSRKPAVLAITGAFAKADYMSRLPLVMEPDYAGFVAHLPGNHSPELSEVSIDAFARAFDEVVDQLARPVVVLGVSVGALVALAMTRQAATVAVEPPLNTGALWPMMLGIRPLLEDHGPFLWEIFGFSLSGCVSRRYRHLVDSLSAPTTIVVGDEPLWPRREITRYPSFVTDEDRAFLATHPKVSLHVAQKAGHDVPLQASGFLHPLVLETCASTLLDREATS